MPQNVSQFDKPQRVRYNMDMPVSQTGTEWCAVTYGGQLISSRFRSRGGNADVEMETVKGCPYRDFRGVDGGFTYHKSVLTARLQPERST